MTRPTDVHARFVTRHIGVYEALHDADSPVLSTLAVSSLEELAQAVVPAGLPRLDAPEHTEPSSASGGLSEAAVTDVTRQLAAANARRRTPPTRLRSARAGLRPSCSSRPS